VAGFLIKWLCFEPPRMTLCDYFCFCYRAWIQIWFRLRLLHVATQFSFMTYLLFLRWWLFSLMNSFFLQTCWTSCRLVSDFLFFMSASYFSLLLLVSLSISQNLLEFGNLSKPIHLPSLIDLFYFLLTDFAQCQYPLPLSERDSMNFFFFWSPS